MKLEKIFTLLLEARSDARLLDLYWMRISFERHLILMKTTIYFSLQDCQLVHWMEKHSQAAVSLLQELVALLHQISYQIPVSVAQSKREALSPLRLAMRIYTSLEAQRNMKNELLSGICWTTVWSWWKECLIHPIHAVWIWRIFLRCQSLNHSKTTLS